MRSSLPFFTFDGYTFWSCSKGPEQRGREQLVRKRERLAPLIQSRVRQDDRQLATLHMDVYWVVANGGILMPVRSSPMMIVRAVGEC